MTPTDFDWICRLVRERSGIVLGEDKRYLVESRLAPVAHEAGIGDIALLVARLRPQPWGPLHKQVVEAMTTNETFFFRDVAPFEVLREQVLPALVKRREKERKLTIWCAACSAGQEPYSIAMVIREHFPSLSSWQVRILASDLNVQMVNRTKEGRYSSGEVTRGLNPASVSRWFSQAGSDYVVKDELKRMIDAFPLNLLDPWSTVPACDILFIRNVLIYFDVDTKKAIFAKVHKTLAEDGFLYLGGAESTMNIDERFVRLPFERAGCYRKLGAGEVRDSGRSDRYNVVPPATVPSSRTPAVVVVDGKVQATPPTPAAASAPAVPPSAAKGLQQSVTDSNRRVLELLRTPPPAGPQSDKR